MRKLPKGKSDFSELIKNNYVYIDKTNYIEMLENSNDSYVHFLRPRRFGKSLFTSMLACYYDIALKDEFDTLFKDTYIHEHPTKEKNDYYVLNFDFSGLNTNDPQLLVEALHNRIYRKCQDFLTKYHSKIILSRGVDAADTFFQFLSQMKNELSKPIYVIIDEYDHFANELLSFDFNNFQNMVSKNGYVRKFYEVLKMGAGDGTIGRIFVTGVSPITLDSMTSGYNISTNLTLDPRFNEMMGFTTEEMKCLISMVDAIQDEELTLSEMKQHYDGYRFSYEYQHHVYNPNMALYYLDYYQNIGQPPMDLTDPNILSDYKKIENLLKIKPNMDQQTVLEDIIANKEIKCRITLQFNLDTDFTKTDFISLLYYLGYLTIVDYKRNQATLKVPNDVIRSVYFDYFKAMLQKCYHINTDDYAEAMYQILDEKKNTIFVKKIEEILHSLDNRDYIKFNEQSVKIAAMSIAGTNSFILTKSEYPVPEGYIDLVLFPYQTDGAIALIELKYIKVEDLNEKVLQSKREEAYAQLVKYKQAKEFQNVDVVKWILIFCKDKCVLNEEIE